MDPGVLWLASRHNTVAEPAVPDDDQRRHPEPITLKQHRDGDAPLVSD